MIAVTTVVGFGQKDSSELRKVPTSSKPWPMDDDVRRAWADIYLTKPELVCINHLF